MRKEDSDNLIDSGHIKDKRRRGKQHTTDLINTIVDKLMNTHNGTSDLM